MTEWQDISTAPRDGTMILVYGELLGMTVVEWEEMEGGDGRWWNLDGQGYLGTAFSHWQPAPEPPDHKD